MLHRNLELPPVSDVNSFLPLIVGTLVRHPSVDCPVSLVKPLDNVAFPAQETGPGALALVASGQARLAFLASLEHHLDSVDASRH